MQSNSLAERKSIFRIVFSWLLVHSQLMKGNLSTLLRQTPRGSEKEVAKEGSNKVPNRVVKEKLHSANKILLG